MFIAWFRRLVAPPLLASALLFAAPACDALEHAAQDVEETTRELATGDDGPAFYSYANDEGRTVFVSSPDLIPPGARGEPVDVSHVNLNLDLGNELERAAAEEHERLAASALCEEARSYGDEPTPTTVIWKHHSHWIAIGAVILVLLLTAPAIASRVGLPRWTRVLVFVIPLLLLLGVITQGVISTRGTIGALERAGPLCEPDALEGLPPDGQVGVVQRLRSQIIAAQQRRMQRIDEAIEAAR